MSGCRAWGVGEGGVMKLKLLTAVLMTMAAAAWCASALIVPSVGNDGLMRWGIAALFAVLAVFYWRSYFTMKRSNTHSSGTE